tara:strand:- start:56 stop:424 length:369 start_codon:yes stop_codon:yes gene_type:complete
MLTKDEMVKSKERKSLRRPLYYIKTSYGNSSVSRQQIWIVDAINYETIAVADTGGYIEHEKEECHTTLEKLLYAHHSKDGYCTMAGKKRLLMSPILDQLEKRLCLDPYHTKENEQTSTAQER